MSRRRSASLEPEPVAIASPRRSTRLIRSNLRCDSPVATVKSLSQTEEKKPLPRTRRTLSSQDIFESDLSETDAKVTTRRSIRLQKEKDEKKDPESPEAMRQKRITRSSSKSPTTIQASLSRTPAKKRIIPDKIAEIIDKPLEIISETEEILSKTENNNEKTIDKDIVPQPAAETEESEKMLLQISVDGNSLNTAETNEKSVDEPGETEDLPKSYNLEESNSASHDLLENVEVLEKSVLEIETGIKDVSSVLENIEEKINTSTLKLNITETEAPEGTAELAETEVPKNIVEEINTSTPELDSSETKEIVENENTTTDILMTEKTDVEIIEADGKSQPLERTQTEETNVNEDLAKIEEVIISSKNEESKKQDEDDANESSNENKTDGSFFDTSIANRSDKAASNIENEEDKENSLNTINITRENPEASKTEIQIKSPEHADKNDETNISIVDSSSPDPSDKSNAQLDLEVNDEKEQEYNLLLVNDDGKSYSPIVEFVDTLQSEETIEAERSTKKETISDERKKSVFDTPKVETPKRETKDEKSTPKVVKPSPVSVEKIKEMDSKEPKSPKDVEDCNSGDEPETVLKKRKRLSQAKDRDSIVSPLVKKKKSSKRTTLDFSDESDNERDDIDESVDSLSEAFSIDEEEEYEKDIANEFIDLEAMEGEEDTPSEDSNQIIDEGESVGSTNSQDRSDDSFEEDDGEMDDFIVDDIEDEELLSGSEDYLGTKTKETSSCWSDKKKRKRIVRISSDEELDKMSTEPFGGFSPGGSLISASKISSVDSDNESLVRRNEDLSKMIEENVKIVDDTKPRRRDSDDDIIEIIEDTEKDTDNGKTPEKVKSESLPEKSDSLKKTLIRKLEDTPKQDESSLEDTVVVDTPKRLEISEIIKNENDDHSERDVYDIGKDRSLNFVFVKPSSVKKQIVEEAGKEIAEEEPGKKKNKKSPMKVEITNATDLEKKPNELNEPVKRKRKSLTEAEANEQIGKFVRSPLLVEKINRSFENDPSKKQKKKKKISISDDFEIISTTLGAETNEQLNESSEKENEDGDKKRKSKRKAVQGDVEIISKNIVDLSEMENGTVEKKQKKQKKISISEDVEIISSTFIEQTVEQLNKSEKEDENGDTKRKRKKNFVSISEDEIISKNIAEDMKKPLDLAEMENATGEKNRKKQKKISVSEDVEVISEKQESLNDSSEKENESSNKKQKRKKKVSVNEDVEIIPAKIIEIEDDSAGRYIRNPRVKESPKPTTSLPAKESSAKKQKRKKDLPSTKRDTEPTEIEDFMIPMLPKKKIKIENLEVKIEKRHPSELSSGNEFEIETVSPKKEHVKKTESILEEKIFNVEKVKSIKPTLSEFTTIFKPQFPLKRGHIKPSGSGSTNAGETKIEDISKLSRKIKRKEKKLKHSNVNVKLIGASLSGQSKFASFKEELLYGQNVRRINTTDMIRKKFYNCN